MKRLTFAAILLAANLYYAQTDSTKQEVRTKKIEEVILERKAVRKESDRLVFDVAASPVTKGSTSFDILKQTPLVTSSDDKTLKIAGKNNAVIFINGRKTQMDAESLSQFLKSTPAENIQKIEVITTPGSEFQVEASDGIINIVLKKKMTDGWNGNLRMSNAQNKYNANSASASLNYRKDKLGVNANLSTSENIQAQQYLLKNGNGTDHNQSEGSVYDPNSNIGGYVNVDYQLTERSNIALTWNSWYNKSYGSETDLFNTITTNTGTKNTRSRNYEDARSSNNNFNLNYELKTDSLDSTLKLNASYLNYKRLQKTNNYTFLVNNGLEEKTHRIYQDMPQYIDNFSGMVDYIKKFNNDFTVSVGGNYNKTKTDNDTKEYYYDANDISNSAKLNHFIYDENIYGVYANAEKKFSEKFSGKIGLRYEITNSLGTSEQPNQSKSEIKQDYNKLLPFLNFNYGINENHNLSYSFSSRMRRPSFWEINPVRNYLTENNYVQNNPFMKASTTYNQELTYMYKAQYFVILNHSLMKDVITQVPLQGEQNGQNVLRYIRTNFGDRQEMSAMFGIQKSFFKQYLTTNFNVGVQHNRNNGSLSIDPTSGDAFPTYTNKVNSTSFVIQTNNTIRLDKKKTWFAGVNFFYVNKQQIELGQLKSLSSLDLSLKKNWENWTFALNVYDVLRKNIVQVEDYQENGNYNYVQNDQFRRGMNLSLTYTFGNQKIKRVRNIESASDDIKSRTR